MSWSVSRRNPRGELRTASTEVVTLVIADEREPISIALAAIDHVVVRSR